MHLIALVTLEGHGGAEVRVRLVRGPEGPVLVGLEVIARPGFEIDDKLMRAIRVPAIRRAVVAEFTRSFSDWVESGGPDEQRMAREAARQATEGVWLTPPSNSRSYVWTDEVLQAFALEAVRVQALIAGGEPLSTRQHMAEWLRQHVKPSATDETARDVMHKARQRNFLAKAAHGSRDVSPGPKLILSDEPSQPGVKSQLNDQSNRPVRDGPRTRRGNR
jgi:hypothetical protein